MACPLLLGVVRQESAAEQLKRLVGEIKRLRQDAARWQSAGRPETADELRALVNVLIATIERIERGFLRAGRRGVPTIFDP